MLSETDLLPWEQCVVQYARFGTLIAYNACESHIKHLILLGSDNTKQGIMRDSEKLLRKEVNPLKIPRQVVQNHLNRTFRDIRDCLFKTYLTNDEI